MELDLNELERLANAAAPGPWAACGPSFGEALPVYLNEVVADTPGDDEYDGLTVCCANDEHASANMAFIAAANPNVVLELVRQIRELKRDAGRYQKLRDNNAWGDDVKPGQGSAWGMLGELDGERFDNFVDGHFQIPEWAVKHD